MDRKNTRSRPVLASMLWTQAGRSPFARTTNPTLVNTMTAAAIRHLRCGAKSRNDFKVHPLGAHVVRNIFGCDREMIGAREHLFGNGQLAGIRAAGCIPPQTHGSQSFKA